jgi:hypothetical protein
MVEAATAGGEILTDEEALTLYKRVKDEAAKCEPGDIYGLLDLFPSDCDEEERFIRIVAMTDASFTPAAVSSLYREGLKKIPIMNEVMRKEDQAKQRIRRLQHQERLRKCQ